MPPAGRTCSECGASLAGRTVRAVTCSENCRTTRSRRIRRANREIEEFREANNAGAEEVARIVRVEEHGIVRKVMAEQLAPIVREAITEDTLRAIGAMVALTPRAVELLGDDLESEDSTVRQRAYTLVTKYTVGHPALVKPTEVDGTSQIVVNFNLPRPDDIHSDGEEAIISEEAIELRLCDMCNTEKPEAEFVSGSSRCQVCFDEWRKTVLEQFA